MRQSKIMFSKAKSVHDSNQNVVCLFNKEHLFEKNEEKLKISVIYKHYVEEHGIDSQNNVLNLYLKSLLKTGKKVVYPCPVCGDIMFTNHAMSAHVFQEHYYLTKVNIYENFPIFETVAKSQHRK